MSSRETSPLSRSNGYTRQKEPRVQRPCGVLSKFQGDLLFTLGALGRGADHRTLEAPGKGTEGVTRRKRGLLKMAGVVRQRRALSEGNSGSSDSSFSIRELRTRMVPLKRLPCPALGPVLGSSPTPMVTLKALISKVAHRAIEVSPR